MLVLNLGYSSHSLKSCLTLQLLHCSLLSGLAAAGACIALLESSCSQPTYFLPLVDEQLFNLMTGSGPLSHWLLLSKMYKHKKEREFKIISVSDRVSQVYQRETNAFIQDFYSYWLLVLAWFDLVSFQETGNKFWFLKLKLSVYSGWVMPASARLGIAEIILFSAIFSWGKS